VSKFFPLETSFLVATIIFELWSSISAVAYNSTTGIVARAIAGLGASGVAPGVYTIAAFSAEPAKRATAGLIGMTHGIAAIAGLPIGGGLTEGASWR
jgi:predicted MFS family arabinose efflux permease